MSVQDAPRPTRAVGHSVAPHTGLEKAAGKARFATDFAPPGLLHALMLRSPVAFGRIVRIDVSRALAMDGVAAVLTFEDVPKVRFGNFAFRKVAGIIDQETKRIQDLFILDDVVKFAGDEIAAVAAVDRHTAEEALAAIVVEYEPLPGVYTPAEAMAP
jgi:CO/xanthine dehydrogenase Mo-binding subunit